MNSHSVWGRENARIVSGEEATEHVGWTTILRFARQAALSIHDTAPVSLPELRAGIRLVLRNILPKETVMAIYPYPTDTEVTLAIICDIRRMLRQGTLLAAVTDKETVGVAGYEVVAELPRTVELRRTAVKKEYQGQGIYSHLADCRLEEIGKKEPTAAIINATRQQPVIRWCQKNNFEEIDWRKFYVAMKDVKLTESETESFDDRVKRFGWRYFYREPSGVATA